MKVEKVIKYGVEVYQNTEMDNLRKDNCMCFNCETLPDCSRAKKLYEICKEENMAMMITRCGNWPEKK